MGTERTGDLVNWADDQRADDPDLTAVATHGQEAIVRAMGGVMASASGCFVVPTMTYVAATANAGKWNLTDFAVWDAFVGTSPTTTRGGRILRADATTAWQGALQLDFTAYTTSGPVGWIRRVEFPNEDVDTRKRWESGSEKSFTHPTKTREGVEIATTSSISSPPPHTPTTEEAWVPFCYISNYSTGGANTVITPITVWDGVGNYGPGTYSTSAVSAVRTKLGVFASAGVNFGLPYLLQLIRTYMAFYVDSTGATNWATVPSRGLSQIDSALDTLEAQGVVLGQATLSYTSVWALTRGQNISFVSGTSAVVLAMPSTINGNSYVVDAVHVHTNQSGLWRTPVALTPTSAAAMTISLFDNSGSYTPTSGDILYVTAVGRYT